MTKTELSRFQALLNGMITELEQLIRHREGIRVERSADELEEVQQASERALAVSNLDREFNQLRNARAAIIRIHNGSFGKCQQCDEEIRPKRLAAVPWTPFCLQCQEAFDRNPEEMPTPHRDLLSTVPLERVA
jgi:DnaK suppressor protein